MKPIPIDKLKELSEKYGMELYLLEDYYLEIIDSFPCALALFERWLKCKLDFEFQIALLRMK